ncbi:ferredoxin--NADP+ reductase [Kribbella aluminosa]|uniref:ferredoxin--NADP(+) reductase n=1 Tax=Kribbella aluminosa TaxID=416017 RepID=A0ABS4UN67_9ACTN|nr:FAD-dependent oxidoreductase [Kribbella aluminosa]MBP2353085.1 ferredoxin--NADP+ reductase [Kribbella aluminosa]
MTFVISGDCCSDASCVAVCPMNSIHPAPGEPGFGTGASLFVDPRTCIDCGACADICPVDAAKPADRSAPADVERNAAYFADREPLEATDLDTWEPVSYQVWGGGPRRVLVVGAGPAGMYATRELLLRTTAEITVVDRSEHLGGLVRFGVAPDHPQTKQIIDTFERLVRHPRVHWRPRTDAAALRSGGGRGSDGRGLPDGYDAVVHAIGARRSRRLGIAGEDTACTAENFVAWYNGRPDAPPPPALVGPGAVVVGNGNVALDIARLLLSDEEQLRRTDLVPDVRRTLAASGIKKVVLLGRRGPDQAAYTEPALRELLAVAGDRVELRYQARPTAWTSAGLTLDSGEVIAAGNLFTAIGFEGRPVDGLPFDAERGIVPNVRGAVVGRPGHYVAGWIKRGARGGIGVNKACAQETVMTLVSSSRGAASPGS